MQVNEIRCVDTRKKVTHKKCEQSHWFVTEQNENKNFKAEEKSFKKKIEKSNIGLEAVGSKRRTL